MSFLEDESSEEDFMQKVNILVNTSTASSIASKGLLSQATAETPTLEKKVSFSMDEEEKKEAERDYDRSREELLSKISRLNDLLKEREHQLADEKDKRKKKEKNLLKLAKELKKRNALREEDMARKEELERKAEFLEHHWVLAQKELEQAQQLQDERKAEHSRVLTEERAKHAKEMSEKENRIAELKKAHASQCDDLCREVLKANLEADRLHGQLNDGTVRQTSFFTNPKKTRSRFKRAGLVIVAVGVILASLVIVLLYVANQMEMLTHDILCGPVMPGQVLKKEHAGKSFDAPFWAPESLKDEAYELLCSEVPPTKISWESDGKDTNRLVVQQGDKTFRKTGLAKSRIFGNNVRVWNKKGLAEDYDVTSRMN